MLCRTLFNTGLSGTGEFFSELSLKDSGPKTRVEKIYYIECYATRSCEGFICLFLLPWHFQLKMQV